MFSWMLEQLLDYLFRLCFLVMIMMMIESGTRVDYYIYLRLRANYIIVKNG